ncbi:MAG: hypothetical protein ACLT98_01130 [Eggerthellaceae bacterium]
MRRAINVVVELVAVVMAPIALIACAMTGIDQAALLSIVVAVASLVLFFAGYEKNAPRLRDTMPVVVLAALAAAGRILFAPFPSFKPVSAIAIIAGAAFGRRSGFMVGARGAGLEFLLQAGPWTPWQMYGWGLIGYLGILASLGSLRRCPGVRSHSGGRGRKRRCCVCLAPRVREGCSGPCPLARGVRFGVSLRLRS